MKFLAWIVGWSLLLAPWVALPGCGQSSSSAPPPATAAASQADSDDPAHAKTPIKTTLALNWVPEPEFGGFYAAQLQGFYAQQNLEVEILPGGAGTPTVQMVGAQQVPFGVVSADEVVIARARGVDVVALFAVYQTNPQGIMVHAARHFANLADVFENEGTLAMEKGLPYGMYLENKYGPGKVKIVPYTGGVAPFLADAHFAQQCFITSEPLAALKQGGDPKVFLVADSGYNPYTAVVVTHGAFLREHRPVVQAMVTAVRQGWRAYLNDPTSTNEHMGKLNPLMDQDTFAAAAAAQAPLVKNDLTKDYGIGVMIVERWETLGMQLVNMGVIDHAPPASKCFINLP